METAYYLATFTTDQAKSVRLKIGRAKPGVTPAAAQTALNNIISANALDPEAGNLTGAKSLQYIIVRRTPLNVA